MIVVDRIEEDFIVLELNENESINVPKKLIPDAKEGDIIEISVNQQQKKEQEEKILQIACDLFEEK